MAPSHPRATASHHRPLGAGRSRAATRPLAYHVLAGDEHLATCGAAGLDVLYRRHQAMTYRYCLGMLRAPEAAADAAQSTWMRASVAVSAPGTLVRNVRPWLRAIARHECLDLLRGSGAPTLDIDALELTAGTTPEDAYETREQLESLLADLGTLSERQRSAIVLRELCGLGCHELADVLDTTSRRASGLVADARRTLMALR